jgi:MoxR-like ATPase
MSTEPIEEEQPGAVDETEIASAQQLGRDVALAVNDAVEVRRELLDLVLVCVVAEGHILVEDLPGVGKTTLARSVARAFDLQFARVQCTADLLPADVVGTNVFNQREDRFEFRPGPIFANVVLVDEINRAMPKTQSALLEAMAERQVTVDGMPRELSPPFLLIATENPIEQEGTFPLPEAQLDRFFLKTALGYPDEEQELRIMREQRSGHPLADLQPVITAADLAEINAAVEDVYLAEILEHWIVKLVRATRQVEGVEIGASLRGTLALDKTARAWALLHGRDFVTSEDLEQLFLPVLGHRLILTPSYLAETRMQSRDEALGQIRDRCLELAPRPEPDWEEERTAPRAVDG